MSHDQVAVISAVRSPFGKFGGTLKDFTLLSSAVLCSPRRFTASETLSGLSVIVPWGVWVIHIW